MRILHVTTFYPPSSFGGDGVFVQNLARHQAADGHQVDVVHCRDSFRLLGGSHDAPAIDSAVRVHTIQSSLGALSPLYTYVTGSPGSKSGFIQRILDKRQPDLIHFHNISLIGGPALLRFGKAVKFYTPHEHWLVCPTHVLFQDGERPCERERCWPCALRQRRIIPPWRFARNWRDQLRDVDLFLPASEFTRRRHLEAGLPIQMETLPLFAANAPEQAHPVPLPTGPFFLVAGRLEKLKGLQQIIPLFDSSLDAGLVIAGEGPYEADLRRLAGNNRKIVFTGQLSRAQLASAFRRACALCVPSITHESFGLVVAEAAALGTPAIVANVGALPELVTAGECGIVCETPNDFGAAMRRLLVDHDLRARLSSAAVAAHRRLWSWPAYNRRYMELVEQVRR